MCVIRGNLALLGGLLATRLGVRGEWCPGTDLHRRHADFQSNAARPKSIAYGTYVAALSHSAQARRRPAPRACPLALSALSTDCYGAIEEIPPAVAGRGVPLMEKRSIISSKA